MNIHFAVAPFRTSFLRKLAQRGGAKKAAGMAASAMLSFRKFLETRGQSLSQTPEFLSYYALPYVPNPSEHPSFKHLLKEKWLAEIRHRLERFLDVILESVNLPDMYKILRLRRKTVVKPGLISNVKNSLKKLFRSREIKISQDQFTRFPSNLKHWIVRMAKPYAINLWTTRTPFVVVQ